MEGEQKNSKIFTIMDADGFQGAKEQFIHGKELVHSLGSIRYCKAEIVKDCMIGTLRIPQKSKERSPQISFGIYMTKEALFFIEGSGNLKQWVDKQTDMLQDIRSPQQLFLKIMEKIIEDDIFYLSHLEKELEELEDGLNDKTPEDFFAMLTKYRRKLSELNAYYEQLTDIGELMQSGICPVSAENTDSWCGYMHRTERLQSYVQLLRENILQLRELYQSQQDAGQNRVMGILTIVTTLFLPLTLLTGWYGMNFAYMPELHWKYGYCVVILAAVLIVALEIIYFKKKKFF
ncbi:MAG: CorA family divalent cation transporter [Lachnospiraceae bacterium]